MLSVLLELLAEGASPEEIEQVLATALLAGVSGTELIELRAGVRHALHVRREIHERLVRERERTELFDTAGDLTSMRDVDQVLSAIVRKAREALTSEAAYLMLVDSAQGDTYMRATTGTISPDFHNIRLPLGAGLGGLTASAASPYSTIDYLSDPRFQHGTFVDEVVKAEGLIAILGVPLMLGSQLIGVLFSADRRKRNFSREEVALLCSLAAYASVALENARLFQDAQNAMRDLEDAKAQIEANSAAMDRSIQIHEQLTTSVLNGQGLSALAEMLARLLEGSVLVVSPTGRILARTGMVDDLDRALTESEMLDHTGGLVPKLLATIYEAERLHTTLQFRSAAGVSRCVTPIIAGPDRLGSLVLATSREVAAVDIRTLERAAQSTALLLLRESAGADKKQRGINELINDLIDAGQHEVDSLKLRCSLLGIESEREYVVAVIKVSEEDRYHCAKLAAGIAGEVGGLAGERDRQIIVALPGLDAQSAANLISEKFRNFRRCVTTIGSTGPISKLTDLRNAVDEAQRCLRVLITLGREGHACSVEKLGIYGLLLADIDSDHLRSFQEKRLAPLVAYDLFHGTDLMLTIETYLSAGRRHAATAEILHIHANTLYQRLAKISELSAVQFDHVDDVFELQLALKVRALQTQLV